ncbi:hypothetical protein G15_0610 [Enterococcus avium]|nr:hypothetical protein G15_0610 [Enterococcus avium]
MISNGYLSSKYDMYDGSYSSASLLNPLLVRIPFIFLLYFSWWKDKIKSQNFLFRSFAYFVILEFIIQPIKLFDYNVARVIWYLNYFLGIGYIMTVGTISIGKIKFAKSFSLIIVVAVLLYIGFYSNIYEQKVNMKGLGLYPYAFWNSY